MMLDLPTTIAVILGICVVAYLIGSVNFAIIVSRIIGRDDIRKHGSGSAGMTNMLRTYGTWPAVITAVGDFGKTVLAVVVARVVIGEVGIDLDVGYIAGVFVIVGHMFPLYFRFKGGKGVMSALGVLFSVNPVIFLIVALSAVPLVFITRIVSIASISGALTNAVVTAAWVFLSTESPLLRTINPWVYTICAVVIGALIWIGHRENIVRLYNGTENRLGKMKD